MVTNYATHVMMTNIRVAVVGDVEKNKIMNIIEEQWKSVIFDNRFTGYEISNLGGVRKIIKNLGRIIIENKTKNSKYRIKVGYKKSLPLDFLVAMAFLPPPPENNKNVFHKDGNNKNCNADNLTWVI